MLTINSVPIEDTFAEAFPMTAARAGRHRRDAGVGAHRRAGRHRATPPSVIGCDAEAGIERDLSPDETPDGRPGVSLLFFAFSRDALQKAVVNRVGQCVLTCPPPPATTACRSIKDKTIRVGGNLRFFGDGWQISKMLDGRRYWRHAGRWTASSLCEDVVRHGQGRRPAATS